MSTAISFSARTKRTGDQRRRDQQERLKRPEFHDFVISRKANFDNPAGEIPQRLVLVRPNPLDPTGDQLYLDQVPIPQAAWRYDAHDRILTWKGAYGGGHLYLGHDGQGATGNIGSAQNPISVAATAILVFRCNVALDCGARYETSGEKLIGLLWDPTSDKWKNAQWQANRLQLTYKVTQGDRWTPPTLTFEFQDGAPDTFPWAPGAAEISASLSAGEQHGRMVWNLHFNANNPPPPAHAEGPATGPDSVYPYWMEAVEDAGATEINGVLQIDAPSTKGTLVGIQGLRAAPPHTGYYRTSQDAAPFGVFDGKLMLEGCQVAGSYVQGDVLHWSALDPAHQQRTGLPAGGCLRFQSDGSVAVSDHDILKAHRLSSSAAIDAIAQHQDLHPDIHNKFVALKQALGDAPLDPHDLLAMNPFAQDETGGWYDAVQAAVTKDLSDIMNSFIPADMWNLVFNGAPQPTLTGDLAVVAQTPVTDVKDPTAFYRDLATAVMTQGLANGSDENCNYLNGPRAAAWLKTRVGASKVYYQHGQLLFHKKWKDRFNLISDFHADQINAASTYEAAIDAKIADSIADINANFVSSTDSAKDSKVKSTLIAQVQEAGQTAKTQQLYWAFWFYTYNTTPGILGNIAYQIGRGGSQDGTFLSRMFQQNAATLTALDPSGYFARQYTTTINTFMATNVLPSMFDYSGDAHNFDLIKAYLQKFVDQNLKNPDKDIAAAAEQMQDILNGKEADRMLQMSVQALRGFASAVENTMALPYVARMWEEWFSKEYPRFARGASIVGSLLIGGISALAIMSLFTGFKDFWSKKLTDAQRAQLVIDALELGIQIVAAVVKRGIRLYAIFDVDGMTTFQRTCAVSEIVARGEANQLDLGLGKIGNRAARWLADTEGSAGKIAQWETDVFAEEFGTLVLVNEVAVEEVSTVGLIFGKNLDEFIATRIGPLFILAGIGFSLYTLIEGEEGVAMASDIVNIVSGSLMIFATIGGWLVTGGLIAEGGVLAGCISGAGVLAIVGALVGVALMLYQMFHQPPNPVHEFVTQYATRAGFAVSSKRTALDYALPYFNSDKSKLHPKLLMIGFVLSVAGTSDRFRCNPDGSITLVEDTQCLPATVWQAKTDGLGMSQILTVRQEDLSSPPIPVYLSLMSDNTVSFQPKMTESQPALTADSATAVTQTWLSAPQGNATLTEEGKHMVTLAVTLQPVKPDARGEYSPGNASGWLANVAKGMGLSATKGTTFVLHMSGMAPNFMTMAPLKFKLNSVPSTSLTFGPGFVVFPSPATDDKGYSCAPELPAFLKFSEQTGAIIPNGKEATPSGQTSHTLTAQNDLGTVSAPFTITVA